MRSSRDRWLSAVRADLLDVVRCLSDMRHRANVGERCRAAGQLLWTTMNITPEARRASAPGSLSGYLASGRRGHQPAGHIKGTWRCDAAGSGENRRESILEVKRHSGAKRLVTQTPGAVRQQRVITGRSWITHSLEG